MQNKNNNQKIELRQRAYVYALSIIKFIDSLDKKDFTVQTISKQLIRSATSVGANITEAQAGSSRKDFINFLSYALKSANETVYWLALLKDSNKTDDNNLVENLLNETRQLGKILGSSIITLKSKM